MQQLQEVVSLALTFCLLAAILQSSLCVADKVYYVTPDSETTCSSTPCHNISHYIQNPSVYFQSNSVFKFLPGLHILDEWELIEIEFVNNIALTGDPTMIPSQSEIPFQPSSEIWCTGQAGFGFVFVENLLIENLSFTNCGTPFSSHSNLSSAILFSGVTNLTISRVVVQNTTGYGIISLALKGDSRIFESAFLYNHGDNSYIGGNVNLLLDNCDNSGYNTSSVSLSICSTYILYGDTPQSSEGFPTGLSVMLTTNLCTNTNIVLDNVTVSQNKNANLLLSLSYSDTSSVCVTIENSRIEGGAALAWGGLIIMDDSSRLKLRNCSNPQNSNKESALRILNTAVIGNIGAGLAILVNSKYSKFSIEIDRVIFNENNSTLVDLQNHTEFKGAVKWLSDTIGALFIMGNSSEICPRQNISHENVTIKIFQHSCDQKSWRWGGNCKFY